MNGEIKRIAILGAGTMGLAIAQFFAEKCVYVNLYSRTEETLEKAMKQIHENLLMINKIAEKRLQTDLILQNIRCFTSIKKASEDADWIIETITEDAVSKKAVIEEAAMYAQDHALISSDTSALNIFSFIDIEKNENLLITHFFNPANLMPLVEIVPGPQTSDISVRNIRSFLEEKGKQTIVIKQYIPGFIANRLTLALAREAFYLAEEGYASIDDIDRVITSTFGPRYTFEGIFDLYDNIGLDVGYAVAKDLLPELCSSTAVPEILRDKVDRGELGIKTGSGFKDYKGKDYVQMTTGRNRKIAKALRCE